MKEIILEIIKKLDLSNPGVWLFIAIFIVMMGTFMIHVLNLSKNFITSQHAVYRGYTLTPVANGIMLTPPGASSSVVLAEQESR